MTVTYDRSPLVEAVFETFVGDTTWGNPQLASLNSMFARDFVRREELEDHNVQFRMTSAGPEVVQHPISRRERHWSADSTRMIQYGGAMVAFNALAPYTHYVDYRPTIGALFGAYVATARPQSINFIGQRYINRISLPSTNEHPADFFTVYPRVQKLESLPPSFAMQIQTDVISQGTVVLNLVLNGVVEQRPTYILDIYARTIDSPPIDLKWDAIGAWHDEAHEAVKRSFELALTKRCQEFLGKRIR